MKFGEAYVLVTDGEDAISCVCTLLFGLSKEMGMSVHIVVEKLRAIRFTDRLRWHSAWAVAA